MNSFINDQSYFAKALKIILYTLGYLVIVTIPISFFLFGWKGVELDCSRKPDGLNPTCHLTESFGIGVYSHNRVIRDITQIGYRSSVTSQSSTKTGFTKIVMSTVVFVTKNGEEQITHSIDKSSEKELISKTREFLENPEMKTFHHRSSLRSVFGWVGLIGTCLIILVLLELARYHFFRRRF